MAAYRKAASRWSLIGIGEPADRKTLADNQLLWPCRTLPANLSPLLAGLAPNRDHNSDLLAAIERLPDCRGSKQPVFSVFAADPFIHGKRIGPSLLKKGYNR